MTHISHPYSVRLGIIRPWKSRWFNNRNYKAFLKEDVQIRSYLKSRLKGMFVDSVEIERSPGSIVIIIKTARPGILIGRGGEGIEKLKTDLQKFIKHQKTQKTTSNNYTRTPTTPPQRTEKHTSQHQSIRQTRQQTHSANNPQRFLKIG